MLCRDPTKRPEATLGRTSTKELFETVNMLKSKHNFTEKVALKFMVNNEQYAAVWGPPPSHKGSKQQWIETSRKSSAGCETVCSPL